MVRAVADGDRRRYTIAAFAIEDRVDFRFLDFDPAGGADALFISEREYPEGPPDRWVRGTTQNRDRDFFHQERLQPSLDEQFFSAVYVALERALQALHDAYREGPTSPLWDIEAFVISVPGVIVEERRVVQLPLWNWVMQREVHWNRPGQETTLHFDFVEVLAELIDRIAPGAPKASVTHLTAAPTVLNDTKACATAAYFYAKRDYESHHHTIFLRAHFGINACFLEDGRFRTGADHSEAGHVLPRLHPRDTRFPGCCPYHGNCFEGLMTPRAFRERARPSVDGVPATIPEWGDVYDEVAKRAFGENLDMAMFDVLVRGDGTGRNALGEEIAAHYIAHLVHMCLLLPPAPERVFIGGRFATERIVAMVRANVAKWLNTYPARQSLQGDLTKTIIRASYSDRRFIELSGALLYAYASVSAARTTGSLGILASAAKVLSGSKTRG